MTEHWEKELREAVTRKGGIEMRGGETLVTVRRGYLESALVELEQLRMSRGRRLAANAVWMQLCSWLARNDQQELAQKWKRRADKAAADVRPEDFVVAKP